MEHNLSNAVGDPTPSVRQTLAGFFTVPRLIFMVVLTTILTYLFTASAAFAQSDTIEIDMAPFFTNMNTYIPIFFSIFAIVGGIMAAMALSKLVINAVVGALSGRATF